MLSYLKSSVASVLLLHALCAISTPLEKRAVDFYDPRPGGGSMLDNGKVRDQL